MAYMAGRKSLDDPELLWELLGAAMKQRRQDLGLSQEQACEGVDISPRTWSGLESGDRRTASLATLKAIDESLRWPEDRNSEWILRRTTIDPELAQYVAGGGPSISDAEKVSREFKALAAEAGRKLDPDDLAAISAVVRRLLADRGVQ